MDAPSVDDAALKPLARTVTKIRPRYGVNSPLDCIGEIEVDGEPALVVWPQLGDAVAVDFKRDGHRYALVTGLNSPEPKLTPEPLTGRQIAEEHESHVLEGVVALWAGTAAASASV